MSLLLAVLLANRLPVTRGLVSAPRRPASTWESPVVTCPQRLISRPPAASSTGASTLFRRSLMPAVQRRTQGGPWPQKFTERHGFT